jgi:PAS domain S-box-containing protein
VVILSGLTISAAVKETRRVLVFYEAGFSFPDIAIVDQEIRQALDRAPYKIELYTENMEEIFFSGESSQQEIRQWYLHKYRDRKPDLIIAEGPPSLKFMVDAHERFFPGTPIVFCCSPQGETNNLQLDSSFTGAWMEIGPVETLEAALRLQPRTRHVVVVGGVSSVDKNVEEITKEALHKYESSVEFTYLTNLAMPALLERLRHLQDRTIVFYTSFSQDAAGTSFVDTTESIPMIVGVANAPVFVMSETFLGQGAVGGSVTSFRAQGRVVGDEALRILSGEKPEDIPIVRNTNIDEFDWRALKRWRIKKSNLPPGSIVLNRQPSFWELYEKYVLIGILLLLVQSVAIVGLLWQRARRRKTEVALRRSEEKFSKSFHHSPLAVSLATTNDDRYLEVNHTFEQLTAWGRDEVVGRSPLDINLWVDPDRRFTFLKNDGTHGNVRDPEVRIRRKDGQIRTMLGSTDIIEVEGESCALSVFADITERKEAEEALSCMSRRLIAAQEQERTRIARELHDDINQRIAMLSVEFDRLEQSEPASAPERRSRVKELQKRLLELGTEIQAISHRLHSSKLEYLGLVVACGSFCREVAERQKVTVDFAATDVPREVPQDVSLCLFRVLQESLNNAIKYSGVQHFEVRIQGSLGEIQLTVHDDGAGFDAESAMSSQGLGLISMRERVSLVNGTMSIISKPGGGTEVSVRVPLVSAKKASEMVSGAA